MKKMIVLILAFLILAFCVGCEAEKPAEPCEVHAYGEWTLEKEASCSTEGEMKRVCQNCDASETKAVDPLEHSFGDWAMQKEATCDAEGMEARSCSLCGASEERATSMVSHVMGEWTVAKESTCTETGLKKMSCVNCDHEITEEIPKAEHTFGDWNQVVISTCEEAGSDERVCGICNVTETREVPQKAHDNVGVRCNYCNSYIGSAAIYGQRYSLGMGFSSGISSLHPGYIEVKSCVQTKTATGTTYTITYSADIPSSNLYDQSTQNSKYPMMPFMPTKVYLGTLALYCDDGKYYTGEMKPSHCDITVPEGVKVLGLEYVNVIHIQDSSNQEMVTYKSVLDREGTLYWQIPVEE